MNMSMKYDILSLILVLIGFFIYIIAPSFGEYQLISEAVAGVMVLVGGIIALITTIKSYLKSKREKVDLTKLMKQQG